MINGLNGYLRKLCWCFAFILTASCLAGALSGCANSSGLSSSSQVASSAASSSASSAATDAVSSSASSQDAEPVSSDAASQQVSGEPESDTVWTDIPDKSTDSPASSTTAVPSEAERKEAANAIYDKLGIEQDLRQSFKHGKKPAKYQKYIVLHDTEGEGKPSGVIDYWDGNGRGIAAHFVVGKDGEIVQCVDLDVIAHHSGFGDTGHNEKYGVEDESRDDKVGTEELGEDFADYGMNSYSIGIEMIHVGGEGDYPEKQLKALDGLIAYIDTYYGKESTIIDHKAWRSGNSDTSEEFADYLANYQDHRTHLDE